MTMNELPTEPPEGTRSVDEALAEQRAGDPNPDAGPPDAVAGDFGDGWIEPGDPSPGSGVEPDGYDPYNPGLDVPRTMLDEPTIAMTVPLSAEELSDAAKAQVLAEWDRIQRRTEQLAAERNLIANELRIMRQTEALWEPIVRRLTDGIPRRTVEADSEGENNQ